MEEAIAVLRVANADDAVAWYGRLGSEKEWERRFGLSFPAPVSIARHRTARLFPARRREER